MGLSVVFMVPGAGCTELHPLLKNGCGSVYRLAVDISTKGPGNRSVPSCSDVPDAVADGIGLRQIKPGGHLHSVSSQPI